MKMWQGRFKKEEDERVNDFNSSISFDSRMYKQDITGSIAHAKMLGKQGIIDASESEKIVEGLKGILADIESGALQFDMKAEDIHMFVEQVLTERIGDAGKRLHTSRSRNDQVALDIRMYLMDEITEIKEKLKFLANVIIEKAKANTDTVMSGYTHLQRAQPVTMAHQLLAYAQMIKRDMLRLEDCYDRTNIMPLGSCALAGTTYDIDRVFVAEQLGFADVTDNSIDGVSDRDFVLEL
ncbi:MAG: argininosuccinate lyase, partial [Clostridia bacterium]|nr:argininosuccinate lyase [Clostridia bacterium]